MAIIVALVIALICSAVIAAGYFYRQQYQVSFRHSQLQLNIASGTNIVLADTNYLYSNDTKFGLFHADADSVALRRTPWGIFDVGVVKAFTQRDTLSSIFLIGRAIDSAQWASLYIIDENRPISVSWDNFIRGDVYLPKGEIQTAYVDNRGFEGDKRLVIGKINKSKRELPSLDSERLGIMEKYFDDIPLKRMTGFPSADTISNSFLLPVRYINLGKEPYTIAHTILSGNLIITSDTTLTIDSTARLDDVIVFARSLLIGDGFKGRCQLYATDTLQIGHRCRLEYPSSVATLRYKKTNSGTELLSVGKGSTINGTLTIFQKFPSQAFPILDLTKNVAIYGQVYCRGVLTYHEKAELNGSVYASRFRYKTEISDFENYLVGSSIDGDKLSRYYLPGMFLPGAGTTHKIIQWLQKN
ncbi:hypothetical protein IDJ77_08330 [Mucilaginibacter sp. ZT4R22]|uniref:Uncharacterized protein n=1 Tax=Mucilaginibacter pankratovii TaxID=2772110 RepID=A0ABR7WNR4_9SPHI|nr:hypothetical protein [Mucilaginibacter pankratovii]MBD1363816.1 hypothetical protein [Mucilaginibacter pankratovii]